VNVELSQGQATTTTTTEAQPQTRASTFRLTLPPLPWRSPWVYIFALIIGGGATGTMLGGSDLIGYMAQDAICQRVDSATYRIMAEMQARDDKVREDVAIEMQNFAELLVDAFPQVRKSAEKMEARKSAGESIRRAIQAKRDNARTEH